MRKLTQHETETMTGIESKITVINEELANAKGRNRKGLIICNMDVLLDLFTQLRTYRRLSLKEKFALKAIKMYCDKGNRHTSNKIKLARSKAKVLIDTGNTNLKLDKDWKE